MIMLSRYVSRGKTSMRHWITRGMAAVRHRSKSTIPLKWVCDHTVVPKCPGSYTVTVAARMGLFLAMHDTDTDVAMASWVRKYFSRSTFQGAPGERGEKGDTGDRGLLVCLKIKVISVCLYKINNSLSLSLSLSQFMQGPNGSPGLQGPRGNPGDIVSSLHPNYFCWNILQKTQHLSI